VEVFTPARRLVVRKRPSESKMLKHMKQKNARAHVQHMQTPQQMLAYVVLEVFSAP
jgi:hypothetical protein